MAPSTYNAPVPGLPFFAPRSTPSPGTALHPQANVPTLFTPLRIRGATLRNRIAVAPMCQYSCAERGAATGALTPYHAVALGGYALKGAGLVFVEACAVQARGRISPNCPGLWADGPQVDGLRAVADVLRSQGALCGIQLAHAGRKASTVAPFVAARFRRRSVRAGEEVGGWPRDVVGPSGGEEFVWDGRGSGDPDGGYHTPRELSRPELQQLVRDWASAAERSVRAGVDVIGIHAAHGYLLHQFLSPLSNRRADEYGGCFEGRTRLLIEIVKAIRQVIPQGMPLFLRVSATEWMEHSDLASKYGSWDEASTTRLALMVSGLGVDLLDVSSGGNHPEQRIQMFDSKDYQVKMAASIRKQLRASNSSLLVGAVGLITEAEQARDIVGDGIAQEAEAVQAITDARRGGAPMADVVLIARQFMREPEWVLKVAWKLGVEVAWPCQFDRVRFPKL